MGKTGKLGLMAAFVIGLCATCMACYASKDVKQENTKMIEVDRNVGYFSRIESTTSADIVYEQGKSSKVRIVGNKDLVDNLVVERNGEKLVLKSRRRMGNVVNFSFDNGVSRQLTVYVTSPDLTEVVIGGSGDFVAHTDIDSDVFTLSSNGSADITLRNVVCDNFKIGVRGSGDIKAQTIDCRSASVEIHGSGDAEIGCLKSDAAELSVMGSGDVDATLRGVANTLLSVNGSGDMDVTFDNCGTADCRLYGSGDIELKGSLGSLTKSKAGSGDIDIKELRLTGKR